MAAFFSTAWPMAPTIICPVNSASIVTSAVSPDPPTDSVKLICAPARPVPLILSDFGGLYSSTVHSILFVMPMIVSCSVTFVPTLICAGTSVFHLSWMVIHSSKRFMSERIAQAFSGVVGSSVVTCDSGITGSLAVGWAVGGDDHGAAEADVVLQGNAGVLDLALVSSAAQLPGEFGALGKAGGAQRVTLRDQPT